MIVLVHGLSTKLGYGTVEFKMFSVGCGSLKFEALMKSEGLYD